MKGFVKRLSHASLIAIGGLLMLVPLAETVRSQFLSGSAPLNFLDLQAQAQSPPTSEIFQQVNPAVVEVRLPDGSRGSGFIVDPSGLIITNAHVIDNQRITTVTIRLANGHLAEADILGYDRRGQDLAALLVYGSDSRPTLDLHTQLPQTGEQAYAIGFPYNLGRTLTTGVVSQVIPEKGWIQTDADINPGNSGGPLLNSRGEVMGVNTWSFQPSPNAGSVGLNTAIAAYHVRTFLLDLHSGDIASQPTNGAEAQHPRRNLLLRGQTITGHFGEGDRVHGDQSYIDYYYFEGRAGQHFVAEMASDEVDAFLSLRQFIGNGNNNDESQYITLAYGDDLTPTDTNARIAITLPVDGAYRLDANTFDGQQIGGYTLSAHFSDHPPNQVSASETRFFCGTSYDRASEARVDTTYYWQGNTKSPLIRWKSQYFLHRGVPNPTRCTEAAIHFQTAYEENRFFFQSGTQSERTVICAVAAREDSCGEKYLFELKPNDDPDIIVDWLTQFFGGNRRSLAL